MVAIVAGAVLIAVPSGATLGQWAPSLAVLGACLSWGIDNNLTRKVALSDATWLAAVKGLVAGPTNLVIAVALGSTLPAVGSIAVGMTVGLVAYGISLALIIVGMRHVGTARAGAYFSIAPFFGAILAVALGEPMTLLLGLATAMMLLGVWLHLSERHEHPHTHLPVAHDHWHTHGAASDFGHHDHQHDPPVAAGTRHRHAHRHVSITHVHPHFPDSHHRHRH